MQRESAHERSGSYPLRLEHCRECWERRGKAKAAVVVNAVLERIQTRQDAGVRHERQGGVPVREGIARADAGEPIERRRRRGSAVAAERIRTEGVDGDKQNVLISGPYDCRGAGPSLPQVPPGRHRGDERGGHPQRARAPRGPRCRGAVRAGVDCGRVLPSACAHRECLAGLPYTISRSRATIGVTDDALDAATGGHDPRILRVGRASTSAADHGRGPREPRGSRRLEPRGCGGSVGLCLSGVPAPTLTTAVTCLCLVSMPCPPRSVFPSFSPHAAVEEAAAQGRALPRRRRPRR